MHEKVIPTKPSNGNASNSIGLLLMPRASMTSKITTLVNSDLKAAHSISASTTSSSRTGAFMMPSQVRCTCMRENAEYSASNDAAFMALVHMEPLAKNKM